jgi:hypothetical protein
MIQHQPDYPVVVRKSKWGRILLGAVIRFDPPYEIEFDADSLKVKTFCRKIVVEWSHVLFVRDKSWTLTTRHNSYDKRVVYLNLDGALVVFDCSDHNGDFDEPKLFLNELLRHKIC